MGLEPPADEPATVEVFLEDDDTIYLPRGVDSAQEFEDVSHLLQAMEFKHKGSPININWNTNKKLRPQQEDAVPKLVQHGTILNAECGTGKTIMAINAITRIKQKVAIIVDLEFLVDQWKKALLEFTDIKEENIGLVGLGKDKVGDVTICMMQTLLRRKRPEHSTFYDSFPLMIVDECHSAGSLEYFKVLNRFSGRRMGLTATIERTDKLRTFIWSLGEHVIKVEGENYVPDIYMLPTETTANERSFTFRGKVNDQVLRNILCANKPRTEMIIGFMQGKINDGRHIIILTHRREHAKEIFDGINCERKSLMLGKKFVKKADRATSKKAARIEHEDPQLIVATYEFLSKGFDNNKIDMILFATPFAAKNTIQQSVGRILRIKEGKLQPVVYDVYDPRIGYCYTLAQYREKVYNQKGYNIKRGVR